MVLISHTMWLFDNLFGDQNTQVLINNGEEREPISMDPPNSSTQKPINPPTQDAKNPQDDASLGGLFEDKESQQAEEKIHPEPKRDIALDIGHSPSTLSDAKSSSAIAPINPEKTGNSSESIVSPDIPSFDIGGDISFDIIGKTDNPTISPETWSWNMTSSPTWLTQDTVQISAIDSAPQAQDSSFVLSQTPITTEISPPSTQQTTENPADLSHAPHEANMTIQKIEQIPWEATLSEWIPSSSANNWLLSLIDNAEEIREESPSEAQKTNPTPAQSSEESLSSVLLSDTIVTSAPEQSLSNDTKEEQQTSWILVDSVDHSFSHEEFPENTVHTVSSPLQYRLSDFIGQLEDMSSQDSLYINEKQKQIEVLKTLKRDIAQEGKEVMDQIMTRIKNIDHEIALLQSQMKEKMTESSHIAWAVTTFQQELEKV